MKLIFSVVSTEIDFRAVSTEIECGFYHVHDHGYTYPCSCSFINLASTLCNIILIELQYYTCI